MKNRKSFWTETIPIWVSRKTANGDVSAFSVSGWVFMLVHFLILLNVILWGGYGIYEWVKVVA
jgi:hypothetical protein